MQNGTRQIAALALTALLLGPPALAQDPQVQGGISRYPWDDRPMKCLMADASASSQCKIENWPDFYATEWRFKTLISNGDAALIIRATEEIGPSDIAFPSGEYAFEAMYTGLSAQLASVSAHTVTTVTEWGQKNPRPGFAVWGAAVLARSKAWIARGNGYANTVSPESWKIYRDKLNESLAILDSAPEYVRKSGPGQLLRLQLTYEIPSLKEQRSTALQAASNAWPYSLTVYGIAMNFAQPIWGGTIEEMESIANLAAKNTSARWGDAMYALAYERVICKSCHLTLKDTAVDWPRMKRAFRDVEKHNLGSMWMPSKLAELACQMRDQEEARRLLSLADSKRPRTPSDEVNACRKFAGMT